MTQKQLKTLFIILTPPLLAISLSLVFFGFLNPVSFFFCLIFVVAVLAPLEWVVENIKHKTILRPQGILSILFLAVGLLSLFLLLSLRFSQPYKPQERQEVEQLENKNINSQRGYREEQI